ncbi:MULTISPECIES: non-ribosomal peptide synthetase [Planktothrix]|uniref:Non ribosomal peptide synthetase, involved in aeruginosin biosynthesis n=2 Tax=Planktothrix TaxID=54304 RepID=A0A6J7ZFJ3_PLARU|nr:MULTISPECIES: non-ribosomal peptide synthetase [Planktothrix]CAC5339867.1 non ribosomal peptide synthetase, involved in aeruginosin biosynthesis [Planktothrix rubescens NIVA-CYA 18]CAD5969220.1 Linear gramicidin synthase subunit C [Planktothrix rubescens NIVA-CYA 18]CAQ48266.1 AerB protein [Planktothrix prolifica NIVA-CYA 98]
MKVVEFLSYLNSLEIKLWLEEDKLKYQAPQGVMTAEIKQEIGTRKSEILDFLSREAQPSPNSPESVIIPVSRDEDLPLSFAQQRMWFLYQMDSQNPAYNECPAIRLTGNLNIDILEQSLNAIIQRHEILRTTFPMVEGKPIQKIAPFLKVNLLKVELKDLPIEKVEEIVAQELQKPFDLTQSPLLRFTLFDLGYEDYILVPVIHHIIIDGWSKGILFKELSSFYQALLSNSTASLPELTIQYADFAVWQRQWLQGEVLANQLNYWKKQLAAAPPLLELPTDKPRPPIPSFRGSSICFKIDSDVTEKLKSLSQKSGVTLFMTLLATLNTLLFRYSSQKDILVGTPTANRNRQEIEPLIGFFVNTLVMRNSLEGNLSFSELLQQVRNVVLESYANQDVPFEQVVDGLQIERSLSYNPLFQVMFALQNTPLTALDIPGLRVKSMAVENVRVKFDLTLILEEIETDQGTYLEGYWEYNGDLYTAERITRLMGHFQTLLKGIVKNPQQKVGELPLLTDPEKQQILVEWNQTQVPYQDHQCIHQLFEEQVAKNPDAVAVIYEQECLTYQQLNQKANQLAHYLQSLGIKTEELVGVCVERSPLIIIGILGILKAGAAYLPLDPSYPPNRLIYMVEDSGVSVVLTQEKLANTLQLENLQKVYLDQDWPIISQQSSDPPVSETQAKNLAYVIYTSGSTGKPKGVLLAHKGVCNLATQQRKIFNIKAQSRVLQFASFSFDASVWEIFMALGSGATLVMGDSDSLLPGENLLNLLKKQKITIATLPPSALAVMPTDELPDLQSLIVAGESSSADLLKKWCQNRHVFNAYGPTESTVCTTIALIKDPQEKPPIGKPLGNFQVYILDPCLNPVPIGINGELYIGGEGLAKGYLGQPELTNSKFISNPFNDDPASRLYKTGDIVRYLADGNIDFMGRIDHQIKIRGFRIELGEIETVLSQHPQVQEGIVIAREDELGVKRLSAYVIPVTQQLTRQELRQFLQDKLPNYMVPAFLMLLDSFPLTPNGKVDRRALPIPEIDLHELENYIAPSTDTETILAQIWQSVLGRERISIHDNFFELGGDSIIGIQIVAKANQAGLGITPKQLFSHQTIAQLATVTEKAPVTQIMQDLVSGQVPLTPIQQWFFEQNLPELHHFNQSVFLEVPAHLQPDLLKPAIAKLLYHHDALRLRFVHKQGQWQQYHSDDWESFGFEVMDLSPMSSGEQLTTMAEISEAQQRSLNLEKGPLISVVFFQLGDAGRLLIIIHHLVVDGVSWRIFLEDLLTSYHQLETGKPLELPLKTSSFKHWAEEIQNYAQNPEHKSYLDYWLKQDFPSIPHLPLDYQTDIKSNTVAHARTVSFTLGEEQTRLLLQDVPQAYNTQINDVLLTALVQAFARWTGFCDLVIDIEGHGRENVINSLSLSRTIGWFTSIFPVILTLKNIDHPGECLKSVKEQLRQIPNRGVDYGIGYYLNPDLTIQSRLRSYPKPEISFNYLGQFTRPQIGSVDWKFSKEASGSIHSPLGQRCHLIAINGLVVDGKLEMEWQYSENFHQKTTIENLANAYQESLEILINHCLSGDGGYTPSDFPDADLNQAELDELLLELD